MEPDTTSTLHSASGVSIAPDELGDSKTAENFGKEERDASDKSGVPNVAIDTQISYEVLKHIPEESAQHYRLVPLDMKDGVLAVGMVDPDDMQAVDALNFITRKTGMPYKIYKISEDDLKKAVGMYRGIGTEVDNAVSDLKTQDKEGVGEQERPQATALDLEGEGGAGAESLQEVLREDAPAIKIVSTVLRYAIEGKASDVHIEPMEESVRVRYRVDGILHTSVVLPKQTQRAVVARVKVLASIRLDEKRKPQDGRFSATVENRKIDFRVSTFPSYYGEKVVIRILDRERGYFPLEEIGMTEREISLVRNALKLPHGLILISGPTGSGKSTTLYSMLGELDREQTNVLSLEDPIEYHIEGVNQSQVRPEIGYNFANGLRTTLRQDPDVIMVGEIRDGETARLAVQAALTGHLVLSTIHTNSAVGTIPRLLDMGVEPYLIAPTLVLSMAQRLVKQFCPGTGRAVPVSESQRAMIERQFSTLPKEYRPDIGDTLYEPESTPECLSGVRGRAAVFEVLEMSPEIERVILKSPVESEIWAIARKQGMLTMKESAIIKAFNKKVPFSEVELLSGLLLAEEKKSVSESAPN